MASSSLATWDTVIGANILPLHADGSIDWDSLERHLHALMDSGIETIFVNAVTGEGPLMTPSEREQVLRLAVSSLGESASIGACLHPSSTQEAIETATAMREQGASAILVFPHPEFAGRRGDSAAAVRYFEAISGASELPLVVYQATMESGMQFSPSVLQDIAAVDGVAAIKEGSWNLSAYHTTVEMFAGEASRTAVLADGDTLLTAMLRLGADGIMSGGTAVVASRLVQSVYNSPDFGRSKGDEGRLKQLTAALYQTPFGDFRSRVKTILATRGEIKTATVRAPLPAISAAEARSLIELTRSLNLDNGQTHGR
ncbi:MAG TPA: dihydrodipicolinate synthase family protein [Acidobacteriaceae bacterium]|nr:dihydrodipicolinate synthase family protein [Acidobacteriaceae bacterium]